MVVQRLKTSVIKWQSTRPPNPVGCRAQHPWGGWGSPGSHARSGKLQAAEKTVTPRLVVELPAFDHAVLYHQATASSAGGGVAVGPLPAAPQLPGINPRQSSLIVLNDPEVSRPSLLVQPALLLQYVQPVQAPAPACPSVESATTRDPCSVLKHVQLPAILFNKAADEVQHISSEPTVTLAHRNALESARHACVAS